MLAMVALFGLLSGQAQGEGQPIRNFLQVTPEFCTAGQPRPEHFAELKAKGIKAVLNLRQPSEHRADEEKAAVEVAGMKYFNIPVVYAKPTDEQVDEFLKITDDRGQPSDAGALHGGDPRRWVLADPPRAARRTDVGRRARGSAKGRPRQRASPRGICQGVHRIPQEVAEPRLPMSSPSVRFGRFEFSPASGELLRDGIPVRLQAQPAKVLTLLVQRPGTLVTREELQREVWGDDTHVDFARGLNFCIAQIRNALGDSAEGARYVETVPKQGYRFVAPISSNEAAVEPRSGRRLLWTRGTLEPVATVSVLAVLILGGIAFVKGRANPATVVVVPFYNETGNPASSAIASSLGDALVASLAAPQRSRHLSVIGNAPALRNPFARQDVQAISRQLGAEYLIIGQLKSDGARLRLVAHLIRASDMKHLWANRYDDDRFMLDAQGRTAEAVAAAITESLASGK